MNNLVAGIAVLLIFKWLLSEPRGGGGGGIWPRSEPPWY